MTGPEIDHIKDELMASALMVDSREKLAELIFSVVGSVRHEELPNVFLNIYLRSLASTLRKLNSENRENRATAEARSEWQLMAEAIIGAFTVA